MTQTKVFNNLILATMVVGLAQACATSTTPNDSQRSESNPKPVTGLSSSELVGDWSSEGCEAYPDGQGGTNYLTRNFTFTDERWDLTFKIFGDEACSYPLFSGKIEGPYVLGEPSEVVEGATQGTFAFATQTWTAHAEDMVNVFNQSACGNGSWAVGVPQDVSTTGCIGVAKPLTACAQEYDVVRVDGKSLYFGQRITNMCEPEGRPTALNSYAVNKR